MANSKIYLGDTNIGSIFQGASDISIYLGAEKVYPLGFQGKFHAEYSDGKTYDLNCDGDLTLTSGNTNPNGYQYTAMTSAIIGDCVTSIGQQVFYDCTSLTSVTIPSGVTSIGSSAFQFSTSLTSIDIPNSVISIGNAAFANCTSLTSIDIPSSVISIGDSAFSYCRSLTSINIPSGVTSIGDRTFNYCTELVSIEIPSGVTSFGYRVFYNCSKLESVTCLATTPPTLISGSLDGVARKTYIYVPDASVDAYKAASEWSSVKSRIHPISEKPQ